MEDLKEWLRLRWRYDNHVRYQQYFESWYANLTESQLYYFGEQKRHVENGSLTSWITRR